MNTPIYFDYAATTPVAEPVLEAMLPYFRQSFGNPSSVHRIGQQAEAALEEARQAIADGLNCTPGEIVFTSCGSESDNLAIRGAALAARKARNATHILYSPVEHHAVSHTVRQLADLHGFTIETLPVDRFGQVDPHLVAERIRPDTALVTVMTANNEIGTINPIAAIGAICHQQGVAFHTDAVQAAAYIPLDVQAMNVDLLSIGAHKFYGPKGVGALYVRRGTPLLPSQTGGAQEFGLRAGTQNIPYIVGMATAFQLARQHQPQAVTDLSALRDRLIGGVLAAVPDSRLTGHPIQRLPNHASFVFHNIDGNALLAILDVSGYACSSGSACKTGSPEPSDVLLAIGQSPEWALGSLRLTLGEGNTGEQVDAFLLALPPLIARMRA